MTTMYDAVTAGNIPKNADVVAGSVNIHRVGRSDLQPALEEMRLHSGSGLIPGGRR